METASATQGPMAQRLAARLTAALAPVTNLVIQDDSARHAGHSGARPGGETHFTVRIVAACFAGLPRVARHRLVYAALADELATQVHALALVTLTPEEAARENASPLTTPEHPAKS